jgi:hypothetical protein
MEQRGFLHLSRLSDGVPLILEADVPVRNVACVNDDTTLRAPPNGLVGQCKEHVARWQNDGHQMESNATFLGIGKQFCSRIGSVPWQKKTVERPTALDQSTQKLAKAFLACLLLLILACEVLKIPPLLCYYGHLRDSTKKHSRSRMGMLWDRLRDGLNDGFCMMLGRIVILWGLPRA